MKYIITEDRLDRVINKYIDYILEDTEFIDVKRSEYNIWKMIVDKENIELLMYDTRRDKLFIVRSVIDKLVDMFGIDNDEAKYKIGVWFRKKYGLYPSFVHIV